MCKPWYTIQNKMKDFSSVFIATFSHYQGEKRLPRNGMVEQLLSFFLPKAKYIFLLDQPHVISDVTNPVIEEYVNGKLIKRSHFSSFLYLPIYFFCKLPSKEKTRISYKLRDFVSVIVMGIFRSKRYDIFIGLEAINALAGICLKKVGKVKTVIYYVSDYSPSRFGKTWFNGLYVWLDRFCVRQADFVWDVSAAMKFGRKEAGIDEESMRHVVHVPNGLFPSQIASLPIAKRKKNSLVYLGTLDENFGVSLAIESVREIRKKIPDITLHIIGGGNNITNLKKQVKKLHLEQNVTFYGYVPDNKEMAKIVRGCVIGIAPYRQGPKDARWYGWYGDAGKIRQYLASGLPVVTTYVPPLGRYVAQKGAALMTKDNVADFSAGIVN